MNPPILFSLSSSFVMLAWLYLASAGRWTPKTFSIVRIAVPVLLSIAYATSFALASPNLEGGFGSIEAVRLLFQNDWALTAGWIHYLAFDFFVGCWILEQAKASKLTHWVIPPILLATFMLGPVGYLLFRAVQSPQTFRKSTPST